MAKIVIDESDLAKRGPLIRKLLAPILDQRNRGALAFTTGPKSSDQYFVAAFDKRTASELENLRFATFHKEFRANYYEVWIPFDRVGHKKWCLSKAYLHIYRVNRSTAEETEFVALHADPQEPDGDLAAYKRTPHIHIKASEYPIPKAHIAITIGSLRQVLDSSQTLFAAMKHGIELIKDEILIRF